MTQLETETVITGSFLLAGLIAHYAQRFAREAVREHWFKGSVTFGINPPEGRFLKPRKEERQAPPEPVAEPGNGLKALDGRDAA